MYVDKTFVYLVLLIMMLMLYRMWKNERRLNRIEEVSRLLYKHEEDIDKTIKELLVVLDKLFLNLLEGVKEKKENVRRDASRESETQQETG